MFTGQFQWVLQWSPSDLPDLLFLTLLFLAFPSVLWDPLHSSGKFPRGSSVAYTQENLTDRIWTLTGVCIYKHKFSNIVFIYYAYSSAACIFLTHVSNKKHLLIGAQSWCLFSSCFLLFYFSFLQDQLNDLKPFVTTPAYRMVPFLPPWIPRVTVSYWPDSYCLVSYVSEPRM